MKPISLSGETARLNIAPLAEAHADPASRAAPFHSGASAHIAGSMQAEYREFSGGPPTDSGEIWLNGLIRLRESGAAIGTLQAIRFSDGGQCGIQTGA